MTQDALESYEEVKAAGLFIDQVFFNILINGLMKQKCYKQAFSVWQDM